MPGVGRELLYSKTSLTQERERSSGRERLMLERASQDFEEHTLLGPQQVSF
jgi:hypothetical protein